MMQKAKLQRTTYTIETPLSARTFSQHNNYDYSSTATSMASRSKTFRNPQPQHPTEDLSSEPSGLDTSDNTIHECIKMLSNEKFSVTEESSDAWHSSWVEGETRKRLNSSELRKENVENTNEYLLTLQYMKSRNAKQEETIREFSELMKTPETKKREREVEMKKEKAKELARMANTRAVNSKDCSKQSISKITGSSFYNQKSASACNSANVTVRKSTAEFSNRSKAHENNTLVTRLMTSPQADRESRHNSKQPQAKPYISLASPQLSKVKDNRRRNTDMGSPGLDRFQIPWTTHRGSGSGGSSQTSPRVSNLSLQQKCKPLSISISRTVQAVVTPRGNSNTQPNTQRGENSKPLVPILEVGRKQSTKKEPVKSENKGKQDKKGLKSTTINLVEVDMNAKDLRKRKEDKVDKCVEQLDEAYERLKKTIGEKREGMMKNDNYVKALEDLKSQMISAQYLIKSYKGE